MNERVFLITGASSGIGAATARAAVAGGYRVALLARSIDTLQELAAELGSNRAVAVGCDVTDWQDLQAAVDATLDRFGRIDVTFANAGFGAVRGFLNESPEHWRAMILTNVLGPALTIRATVTALEASGGHVILTGSVAGHVAVPGSVYSATKHAVTAMAESARKELRERGIRVTLISPGNVDTLFFDNAPPIALTEDDVARAVMFAASQPPDVAINEILMRHRDQET
jgi:NADP-dependent 3-hydroxy acid dehydrogenase YdfG